MFVCTSDQSEALDAGEVSMLDGHDTGLSKQLLWVVVDQLSVKRERQKKLSYITETKKVINVWAAGGKEALS